MTMQELARKINRKADLFINKFGIKEFHKKAAELLRGSDLQKHFSPQEMSLHAFSSKVPQHFKHLEFSDLPLTISQGEHCFIDLYFWRRRPTVIHNHHFAGAFMCLLGNNIDFEYTFKKEKKLGRFHDLGVLKLKEIRNLRPGDVAEIAFMDKFIHQNHHQDDLTVNLCLRTPQESSKGLSNYLSSGLRFEKNTELISRVERLRRTIDLGLLDTDKVNLTTDEALKFLIDTYDSRSGNPRLLKLRNALHKRMLNDFGLDLNQMMRDHDRMMEKMENDYD